jgi:D-galactarolactone isomerase
MSTTATAPRLRVPPGAVDTHMHVYERRFPLAPTAPSVPPEAPVAAYREVMRRLGLARCVVVQPTAYGFDNACTLEAVAALGGAARGVAVVAPSVTDGELERLTRAGIRGLRFHMLRGGVLPWSSLDALAARVHAFGWHVQLQLDGRELGDREAAIRALPGRFVIDHVGKFVEPVGVDHPGFEALRRLLDTGRGWVKLSAPYETSKAGPPVFGDVGALARTLVAHAPERMLWATNWPHPSAGPPPPDDAMLLDLLLDWAPDDATRRRILVHNPAELYGFAEPGETA